MKEKKVSIIGKWRCNQKRIGIGIMEWCVTSVFITGIFLKEEIELFIQTMESVVHYQSIPNSRNCLWYTSWSFQQTYQSTNRYDSLKTNQADTPPPHTRRRMASCFLVIRYCTGAYTSLSNPTHYRSALRNSSLLHSTHHLNMSRMSLVSYLLPLLPSTYVQYDHEHDRYDVSSQEHGSLEHGWSPTPSHSVPSPLR